MTNTVGSGTGLVHATARDFEATLTFGGHTAGPRFVANGTLGLARVDAARQRPEGMPPVAGQPGSDDFEVRLKPLDEFRCLVEQRDQFIMIQGEEISDRAEGKPVHINATNLLHMFFAVPCEPYDVDPVAAQALGAAHRLVGAVDVGAGVTRRRDRRQSLNVDR